MMSFIRLIRSKIITSTTLLLACRLGTIVHTRSPGHLYTASRPHYPSQSRTDDPVIRYSYKQAHSQGNAIVETPGQVNDLPSLSIACVSFIPTFASDHASINLTAQWNPHPPEFAWYAYQSYDLRRH